MNKVCDLFDKVEEDFDTVLATDIDFTGSIHFEKPSMIKGKVTGTIDTPSDLVIDTDAVVNADISALRTVIKGAVTGNITSVQDIFVTQTGSLTGDVSCTGFVLEPGSKFCGKCTMTY